jgi:hypothetical protein
MKNDLGGNRCVIVVSDSLSDGLTVNAAAVVALTLGQRVPQLIGPDVKDGEGFVHPGITLIPVPVLSAPVSLVAQILAEARPDPELIVIGFTDTAQCCRTYDEYTERMARTRAADLGYASVGLYGPKKQINRLTGSLPLLR